MDEAFQRSFDNDSLYFVKACLPIIGKHALILFPPPQKMGHKGFEGFRPVV